MLYTYVWMYIVLLMACSMNAMNDNAITNRTYQIKTANGKAFNVSINQIEKFATLHNMLSDCSQDDSNVVIDIPQITAGAFRGLLQMVKEGDSILYWDSFLKNIDIDTKVSMINAANFLNLTETPNIAFMIGGIITHCREVKTQKHAYTCLQSCLLLNDDMQHYFPQDDLIEPLYNYLSEKIIQSSEYTPCILYDQPFGPQDKNRFKKRVFTCNDKELYKKFAKCPFPPWNGVAVSRDKKLLLTRSNCHSVLYLWKAYQDSHIAKFGLPTNVYGAEFNHQNNLLAISCCNGEVSLWSLSSFACLKTFKNDKWELCRFSPQGDQLWLYSNNYERDYKRAIQLIPQKEIELINTLSWTQHLLILYVCKGLVDPYKNEQLAQLYTTLPATVRLMIEGKYGISLTNGLFRVMNYFFGNK